MQRMFGSSSIPFLLNRMWLITWLTVFPLVHFHPEIDHAHGAADHVHGGHYHSVISRDLSWDVHGHSHSTASVSVGDSYGSLMDPHSIGHVFNHDEIGFTLLNKSKDDPPIGPEQMTVLTIIDHETLMILRSFSLIFPSRSSPPTRLLDLQHRIRPPPVHPL